MEFLFPILALLLSVASAAIASLLVFAALGLTAASTVYSYQAAEKAAKAQLKSGGVEITRQDSNAGLTIIYGERAVGGVKVWKDVQRTTFAINAGRTVFGQGNASDGVGKTFKLNAWLNRVDVLGQGPIEGITNIEIEDDSYQAPRFRKRNQAIYRGVLMDGSDTQSALTELANNSDWKASSVGTGVAYMYSRFRAGHLDDNKIDRYYSAEPNMRYHVKGRRIWDPRDVSQSSSDPSTWLWSDNPALCLLDYLTQPYGRNLDYAQLDIDSFKAAADSCDIAVVIPGTTSTAAADFTVWDPELAEYVTVSPGDPIPNYRAWQTGSTQKRLTCNAALDPSNSVLENVKILLQSMRGTLPYHNGTYSLKLEDVEPTSMSVTEDDIIGGISIANGDRSKRFNRTTVVFKNRNKKYKEDRVSWPQLDSAEYAALLAEDNNEELFFEIGLDAVTDYYQAEDLAEFITMSSREQLAASMKIKSKGMLLEPADVIEVTHQTPGWSARKFRVRSVKVNTDQTVDLSLTEYNASTYTWRETSQEPVQEDIGLASPFDDKLPVTGLAAVITRTDTASGVPQGLVDLTFTAPVGESVSEYVVRFKPTGTTVWIENLYPPTQDETTDVVSVQFLAPQHDTTYDLEVNYRDAGGMSGESAVSSFTVPAYRTDLDLDLNTIETEVGEILERDDGLGEFIPSDLSDLATYYKSSELTLQGNIDTANATIASNLSTVTASIASTDATIATLQTQVDSNLATLQAEVDTAEATAAAASAGLQSQVDGITTTLTDLTASTSDVYLQASAPVAGVAGIPDPIPDNSRWYDSDDSNHPYVWDGTQWVSIKDGQVGDNQAAITALQSTVNDPATGVAANASAIDVLDTTVTTLNGTTTSNSTAITTLETTVNDPTTGVVANSGAVSTLQTTTTQHGLDISTNSADITTLETTVNNPTTGVAASASGLSALTTRVTTAEGTITTQSSDITALETTVNDPVTGVGANATAVSGLETRVTTAEGSITTQANDITALETTVNDPITGVSANTSAISGLTTRVTTAEGTITTHTSDITTLENVVLDPLTGVAANTAAVSGLDTRITTAEGNITANSSDITSLETTVNDPATGVDATATGLSALTTRVTTAEGTITTNSSDITSLETTVNNPTTGVAANTTAISGLDTRITSAEGTITSQSSDITSLNSDLTFRSTVSQEIGATVLDEFGNIVELETDLSVVVAASSAADQALDTRVTASEQEIESQASDITSLQAGLVNTDANVAANATGLTALDLRVTSTEDLTTSQATDITQLQVDLGTANGGIAANASGLTALTTRVTTAEGTITANASDIVTINASIDDPSTGLAASASAIDAVEIRVTATEGSISTQSGQLTALESTVNNPTTGVTANATAISGLDTRVSAAEGIITSSSSAITALESKTAPASIVHSSGPIDQLVSATTTSATGVVYPFTPAGDVPLGDGFLHVLIDGADTDDDFRVGYNGTEVGTARVATTVNNNSEQWFTYAVLSTTGQQSVTVWNPAATAGHVKGIVVTYGGIGDPEGLFRGDANLSGIAANASAVSSLDTRVAITESSITSQASNITSLQSSVTTLENAPPDAVVFRQASEPATDLIEGALWFDTDDNNKLYVYDTGAWVASDDARISGNASAIGGLDTRVTAAEGTLTTQATDITTLQSSVTTLETADPDMVVFRQAAEPTTGLVTGALWFDTDDNNKLYVYNGTSWDVSDDARISGNASAIGGLDTRVTATEDTLTTQATDITTLQSSVNTLETADPDMVVFRQTTAPTVGLVDGAIWYDTDDNNKVYVYNGTSWVAYDDTRISGNASAIGGLDTRVTTAEGSITAQATDITTLQSTVDDPSTGVSATATAVSGLGTRVTTAEGDITNLEAEYYVNLDVDGHVTGVRLYNTGTTSGFTVQADQFAVVAPGASSTAAAPFAVDTAGTISMNANVEINGNLVVDGTITQTQMGTGSVGGDQIINGSVSANELEISANTGGTGERMFFNGTDNRIEIFDASDNIRVALGDLTGL